MRPSFRSRSGVAIRVAAEIAASVLVASAADDSSTCVAAFEDAQRFRTNQQLRAAREALLTCSKPTCPRVVADRCRKWKEAVESALPSIVLKVVDDAGRPVSGATITIDGRTTAVPDDGTVTLDPGPHGARAEKAGSKPNEARFELAAGEKSRDVTLRLVPSAPTASSSASSAPPPPEHVEIPTAAYVLGGIGLVGVGAFAYFGLSGKSDENRLASTCSPACSPEDVSAIKSKYIGADVALGLAAISFGVATYLVIDASSSSGAKEKTSLGLGIGPGSAVVRGRF